MTITLTAEQEQLIQSQLATGHYQSSDEIVQIAFQLFADQMTDALWLAEVGQKIDAADASIARGEGIPLDEAMQQIFDRFKQARMNPE